MFSKTAIKESDFPEKVEVIKAYIIDLLKLYLMRVQIPGNEMSDEVRTAFNHFLTYDERYKPTITCNLITSLLGQDENDKSNLNDYILQQFCNVMDESMNGRQKAFI